MVWEQELDWMYVVLKITDAPAPPFDIMIQFSKFEIETRNL